MNRIILLIPCAAAAFATSNSVPAKPTYSKDVAPILNARCVECHRKGEIAPMTFTNYKEVRPWAKAIKAKVVARTMPPWFADHKFGHFENDRYLSDREVAVLSAWADSGAAEGNLKDLPTAPAFEEGWQIGKPDAVIYLDKEVDVPAAGTIEYQYYTVDPGFSEDKWIQVSEIRPGNKAVVHHVIVYIQEPGKTDAAPGRGLREKLSGYAPGEQPKAYPDGVAKLVKAGSKFVFQMHYTTNGTAAKDRSYMGVKFAKGPVKQRALTGMAVNASFAIPAGADSHEVKSSWVAKEDVRIVDLMPHMHVRGKDFKYTAVYPDGREEVLLSVPKYDFNWQLLYQPKGGGYALPKGTRLECVAHFDNSPNNKFNPDPAKVVKWGPQTWEEMMIGWFDYVVQKENLSATGGL
ncbi:MAG: thiol-disulfide isomerase [Candidatus Solibacter usitatus]|nr:thiol-disulfide isomerase [Candidatus Solibacter usitatus]